MKPSHWELTTAFEKMDKHLKEREQKGKGPGTFNSLAVRRDKRAVVTTEPGNVSVTYTRKGV